MSICRIQDIGDIEIAIGQEGAPMCNTFIYITMSIYNAYIIHATMSDSAGHKITSVHKNIEDSSD